MVIYIDITQLEKSRANTGIQRVVKEFLKRASIDKKVKYKILVHSGMPYKFDELNINEINDFLLNIQDYQFKERKKINLEEFNSIETSIFFDIDSNWNIVCKRENFYPLLKSKRFKIFNFIYDLIPIVLPKYAHESTAKNFKVFIDAVYQYSDFVMFDSLSASDDFIKIKNDQAITRDIPTRVVGLGSDFLDINYDLIDKQNFEVLNKKYILFVGTIEPRKNQADVLDSFNNIYEKYDDINLVFIGKQGWYVDELIYNINTHPLKDKRLFWFNNIDDNTLKQFYKNAYLVTYLSKYEGYGLPIAESLNYGNITITSKNSSMYEVGKNFADYVQFNSLNELSSLITLYYENENLYNLKKAYIKNHFKTTTWNQFYESIHTMFIHYEKSLQLKKNHLSSLQFVFISIDKYNLEKTIALYDHYCDFIKEYIIVTAPKCLEEFQQLKSNNKITIINEVNILKEHADGFAKRDHQSKNWLLRASLLNLDILEEEFIMLDDDNQPLKNFSINKFITTDGKYNAYFFHNLLNWHNRTTEYDEGQVNTKNVLIEKNYELLSYSSHAPQIINKSLFKEVVAHFHDIGLESPIDEWSTYFNYCTSIYPNLFNKKTFETLNWPAQPSSWKADYTSQEITFENYYKDVYDTEFLNHNDTFEQKLLKKEQEVAPYLKSQQHFDGIKDILSKNNMIHPVLSFKTKSMEFYLLSLPYFIIIEKDSDIKLHLNYKCINHSSQKLNVSIETFLNKNFRSTQKIAELLNIEYQESIIELNISSRGLKEGIYDVTFDLLINDEYVYNRKSPYMLKLFVVNGQNVNHILKNPKIMESNMKQDQQNSIKNKIKSIPFVGWFTRWGYNLLRLNNLKHTVYIQSNQIKQQQNHLQQQQNHLQQLNTKIQQIKTQNEQIKIQNEQLHAKLMHNVHLEISKQMSNQALLLHTRLDTLIEKPTSKKISKQTIDNFILDDFYLSFEDTFRGSRELILKRYEKYLHYLDSNVRTSLDIGCGRAEWVELLTKQGINAHGIDLNNAMLNIGTTQGLENLTCIDAFEYLQSCEDNMFDLVTAFHIIEHIPYEKLFTLLQEIQRVATPNATILLETPNPKNISVSTYEFYKDPTHLNPLPETVIKFMAEFIGFDNVQVEYLHALNPKDEKSPTLSQDYLIIAKNKKN